MKRAFARRAFVVVFIITFIHVSLAQDGAPMLKSPVISGIAILGNKITDPQIILREMTIGVGDTVSDDEMQFCRERIYSLGLFNKVNIRHDPTDSAILLVEVDERWYLYPVPVLNVVDRDLGKWQYGLGVMHQNFRGRNEKIFAGFALGYNPWVSLLYSNPWIFDNAELFFVSNFSFQRSENKSLASRGTGANFREIHYGTSHTIGKRLDVYRSVSVTAGYNYIEVTEKQAGRTLSPDGIDRFLTLGISAKHDTRNLREYPTEGVFGQAGISKLGLFFGEVDYVLTSLDARAYKTIFDFPSLGMRFFSRVAIGPSVPNYLHQFFGFSERLRGHFNVEREGENIAGVSLEVRLPILREWYLTVPEMPIRQFATWKFGLYAAVFADAGKTWNRSERPAWTELPRGYGAGLHFLLPYSLIVRLERAWNETGQGEWIIDVGSSF